MAKKDSAGNLITSAEGLKSLYVNTYDNRLGEKEINDDFKELKMLKELLCQKRLELASFKKSEEITIKQIDKVLKSLKNNKARDPLMIANELFKDGVIGTNLKKSLVDLLNKVKTEKKLPKLANLANITTLYKGKGEKSSLENERDIFVLTVLRMIIDKCIYLEEYDVIDENMSDSNVGARKK